MTTGQAKIIIKDQSNLDVNGTTANVATNQADLTASSNVEDQDIRPRSVTCMHLFAQDGIFYGALKAGTIFVGTGGVIISSSADGGTPTTGVIISASQIILKNAGVDTVMLDGTTGAFTLQSAASGARVELTGANGLGVYDASGERVRVNTSGVKITATNDTPGVAERLNFENDSDAYESSAWVGVGASSTTGIFTMLNNSADFGPSHSDLTGQITMYPVNIGDGDNMFIQIANDDVSIGLGKLYVSVTGNFSATNYAAIASTWTPSWTCSGSMTISSVSLSYARYWRVGPVVHCQVRATFTLGGTASSDIYFTLPVTAQSTVAAGGFVGPAYLYGLYSDAAGLVMYYDSSNAVIVNGGLAAMTTGASKTVMVEFSYIPA